MSEENRQNALNHSFFLLSEVFSLLRHTQVFEIRVVNSLSNGPDVRECVVSVRHPVALSCGNFVIRSIAPLAHTCFS